MSIIWEDSLSTGVKWQDSQHKELFKHINSFIIALKEKKGKEEIFNVFTFMDDYIKSHFKAEEEAMEKNNYNDAEEHFAEHEHFRIDMEKLKQEMEEKGANVMVQVEVQKRVVDWWRHHIPTIDKKLGNFLKNL